MTTLLTLALLAILVYLVQQMMKHPSSSGMCSTGSCGKCKKCKAESFRFRHRSDCGCNLCEGFRFRQADSNVKQDHYIQPTHVQDVNPYGQANVAAVNTALPFYFDAYGTLLSMGPGKGDPGAVAPLANYNDLYKAAQVLLKEFPDFQITSYQEGGAISDLYLADEEHQKLQRELE
jgi:hypothetical protein